MATPIALQRLSYALIPGNPLQQDRAIEIHNKAFAFWSSTWDEVFKKLKTGERPSADEFLRQDRISVLFEGDTVIGTHLYSLFDLDCDAAKLHSYFASSYSQTALDEMARTKARTAMSFEYFTLAPQWRGGVKGVSIASALLEIGLRIFGQSQVDIALGVCRVDLGVAQMCYEAGGVPLDKGLVLHHVQCDLVGIYQGKQKTHPSSEVRSLANRLWNNKEDFCSPFAKQPASGKGKAA